jgi:hypothetical protein
VVWLFELMMLSREKRFDVSCASNPLGYSSDLIDFGMACHLIQALQRFDHEAIDLSNATLTQTFIFQSVSNDLYDVPFM